MEIKDSGTRRKFETGAVRDMQEGKGRMDLLPWCAVLRVARHFEAGAVKYGDRNWERGIPLCSFMDSAARHIAKYMDGQTDEDHLCAAAWNLLCALWTEEKRPDLVNIPTRPEYAGGAQYGLENEDEMVTETETNPALYAGMYAAAKNKPQEKADNMDALRYIVEKVNVQKDAHSEDYLKESSPLMQKVTEAVARLYEQLEPLENETSDERLERAIRKFLSEPTAPK